VPYAAAHISEVSKIALVSLRLLPLTSTAALQSGQMPPAPLAFGTNSSDVAVTREDEITDCE